MKVLELFFLILKIKIPRQKFLENIKLKIHMQPLLFFERMCLFNYNPGEQIVKERNFSKDNFLEREIFGKAFENSIKYDILAACKA